MLARLQNPTKHVRIVIAFTCLGACLRFYHLGRLPPGLFIDEVWSSYANHYFYGGDLFKWPISAIASQFYSGELYEHTIFGSSTFWIRFPAALFGTLTIPLTYAVGRRLINARVGLLSAGLMTVSAWSLQFSRYAVPGGSQATFYFLAFILCSEYYIDSPNNSKYAIALTILGIGFVSMSGSSKIFFLLFEPFYIFLRWNNIKRNTRRSITYIFLSLTGIAVFLVLELLIKSTSQNIATSTASSIYSYFPNFLNAPVQSLEGVIYRYSMHWNPYFLMLHGDNNIKYSTQFAGELGIITPFTYIGYFLTARWSRRNSKAGVLCLWALLWPIPSSLVVTDNPNALRGEFGLPAMLILGAITLDLISSRLPHSRWKRLISPGIVVVSAVSTLLGYFVIWARVSDLPSQFACGYNVEARRIQDLPPGPIIVQDKWLEYGILQFYGVTNRTITYIPPGLSPLPILSSMKYAYVLTSYTRLFSSLVKMPNTTGEIISSVSCSPGRTLLLGEFSQVSRKTNLAK